MSDLHHSYLSNFEIKMKYMEQAVSKERACCCALIKNTIGVHKQHVCQSNAKPLIQICFEILAKNLDYYFHAINFKVIPTLQLAFLQRASDGLLTVLSTPDKKVSLRSAVFLINSHLKKIDLDVFFAEDMDAILDKLKTTSLGLTDLSVRHNLSHEQVVELIDALPPTLESLELTKCSDVLVKRIMQKCPALKKLNLSGCLAITNRCIEILAQKGEDEMNCKNTILEVLNVRGTNVTAYGCSFALQNIPNLSALSSCRLVSSLCSDLLSGTYNLKVLVSGSFRILSLQNTQHYLQLCSIKCPYITKVVLVGPISQRELDACAFFTNLEDVMFLCHQCDISSFLSARGRNLKKLTVQGLSMNISVKTLLENCLKLKTLNLLFVNLIDIELAANLNCAMSCLEEIFFKKVSLILGCATGSTISMRIKSNLPYSLLFKRSCFIHFEDFVDAIIRCTCFNRLQDLGIDYLYMLPSLAQIFSARIPNIEEISFYDPVASFNT